MYSIQKKNCNPLFYRNLSEFDIKTFYFIILYYIFTFIMNRTLAIYSPNAFRTLIGAEHKK